jgi:uncharacterized protein
VCGSVVESGCHSAESVESGPDRLPGGDVVGAGAGPGQDDVTGFQTHAERLHRDEDTAQFPPVSEDGLIGSGYDIVNTLDGQQRRPRSGAQRDWEVCTVTGEADNRKVVEMFFSALSQGRYNDAEKFLTPQASWWMLAKRGHVDKADWFAGFAKVLPDGLNFELEGTTCEGARIAVRAVARGTTVAGREFDNAYHFLFEMEHGLIRAAWEYGDTLHVERVLRG